LEYLDFTNDILFEESIAVSLLTYGSIRFSELKDMDFSNYGKIIEMCKKISDKNSEG